MRISDWSSDVCSSDLAQVENRRAGFDLTFSMPKSASVMAYVAGDKRILGANMAAVQKTMAWVEKNLAEGRKDVEGRKEIGRAPSELQSLMRISYAVFCLKKKH